MHVCIRQRIKQGLSFETFSAFPVDKLDSCWIMVPAQESHAKAMLKCSPTMRQMRFALCPSRLRDEVLLSVLMFALNAGLCLLALSVSWVGRAAIAACPLDRTRGIGSR